MNKQFSQSLHNAVNFFQHSVLTPDARVVEPTNSGADTLAKPKVGSSNNTLHLKIPPPVVQKLRDNEQLKLLAAKQKTESDIWLKKLNRQNRELMHKITDDVWSKL